MKYLLLIFLFFSCNGSGKVVQDSKLGYILYGQAISEVCIKGVTYLEYRSTLTVQLGRDSKIIPCKENYVSEVAPQPQY